MSDAFVDFVPNVGKMSVGGNSFADFQIIKEVEKPVEEVKKKKAKVKLSDAELQALKEMEQETVAENGGVAVEPQPTEEVVEPKEKKVKNRKSGRRKSGRK